MVVHGLEREIVPPSIEVRAAAPCIPSNGNEASRDEPLKCHSNVCCTHFILGLHAFIDASCES